MVGPSERASHGPPPSIQSTAASARSVNRVNGPAAPVRVPLMVTTHALLATALTPARGPLHSIRLRDRRPALVSAR